MHEAVSDKQHVAMQPCLAGPPQTGVDHPPLKLTIIETDIALLFYKHEDHIITSLLIHVVLNPS